MAKTLESTTNLGLQLCSIATCGSCCNAYSSGRLVVDDSDAKANHTSLILLCKCISCHIFEQIGT